MHAADRSSLRAGAALVGASIIAVTPVAPTPPEIRVASTEVRLAAESSIFNVPFNLFQAIVNIPYNEVQALNAVSDGLFISGPWFVASATNLWGVDPGDPPKIQSVVFLLVPFPALSGLGSPEFDYEAGLAQQLAGLAAAELPVNEFCKVGTCLPATPTSPITGITAVDYFIWLPMIALGQEEFPLFDNWIQISLSELMNGYDFGPVTNPEGPTYAWNELEGTTGPNNLMPWANTTFTLDPFQPFVNFFDSLMAEPDYSGFKFSTFEEVGRAVQTFIAASTFFDPFTPGSPYCAGDCSIITDNGLDYPDLIEYIDAAWPGNTQTQQWLDAYANGTANVPTPEQIQTSIDVLQADDVWDFENPAPPADWNPYGFDGTQMATFFHKLWTDLGFNPPPLNTGPGEEPENVDAPPNGPVTDLRASEQLSAPTVPPSMTSNFITVNLDSAPVAPDSQVTENVSTQAQQEVQSIAGAVTEAPANAAAVPDDADPKAGQTLATDTTRDGNMAVPGKVGGNGTKSRGGLGDALRSVGDQISSSISKVTGGVTGGTKTGKTSTGDTKADESGTGDTTSDKASTGDSKADKPGGRHRAE